MQNNNQFSMVKKERFSDYSFGMLLRNWMSATILPYANQTSGNYSSPQIQALLRDLFDFRQYEVSFQLIKILIYGQRKYRDLSHNQMINYIADRYLADSVVTRWAPTAKKEDLMLDQQQFKSLLAYGLSFIKNFRPQDNHLVLDDIFKSICKEAGGKITNKQYAQFLRTYIGSGSPMAIQYQQQAVSSKSVEGATLNTVMVNNGQQLSSLIIRQIRDKCMEYDRQRVGSLGRAEVQQFFYNVMQLQFKSIDFITSTYFNFPSRTTYAQMVEIVAEIHFREIMPTLIRKERQQANSHDLLLDVDYFKKKMLENCFFFRQKPTAKLLEGVHHEIRSKSMREAGEYITLEEVRSYILAHCCNGKLIFRHHPKKTQLTTPPSIMEVDDSHFEEESVSEVSVKEYEHSSVQSMASSIPFIEDQKRQGKGVRHSSQRVVSLSNNIQICESLEKIQDNQMHLPLHGLSSELLIAPAQERLGHRGVQLQMNSQESDNLKQELWLALQERVTHFSRMRPDCLMLAELHDLLSRQPIFLKLQSNLQMHLGRICQQQGSLPVHLMLGYAIHWSGELALRIFSRQQAKGKATLNEAEIAQLLQSAYGTLSKISISTYLHFSRKLLKRRGIEALSYKEYLQLIARHLAVRTTF